MSVAKEIRDLMGRCSRLEQQVSKLPTRIGNSAGGGGTGGSGSWMVYGDTFEDLPEPSDKNLFGRVTDGEFNGMTCVVNATEDGWVPFTHFG